MTRHWNYRDVQSLRKSRLAGLLRAVVSWRRGSRRSWCPVRRPPRSRPGLLLVLTILMRAVSFTWASMYTIDIMALTRRVCRKRCRIACAGIRRRACRCEPMGSRWLSVVMTGNFERLWRGFVWECPIQPVSCATSVKRSNCTFIWYSRKHNCSTAIVLEEKLKILMYYSHSAGGAPCIVLL